MTTQRGRAGKEKKSRKKKRKQSGGKKESTHTIVIKCECEGGVAMKARTKTNWEKREVSIVTVALLFQLVPSFAVTHGEVSCLLDCLLARMAGCLHEWWLLGKC